MAADSMFFGLFGRLFHSLGAALLKALAPDCFLVVSSTACKAVYFNRVYFALT
jgi:hypothetical protein